MSFKPLSSQRCCKKSPGLGLWWWLFCLEHDIESAKPILEAVVLWLPRHHEFPSPQHLSPCPVDTMDPILRIAPYLLDVILVAVEEMPPFEAALLLLRVLFVIFFFSSSGNRFRFSLERSLQRRGSSTLLRPVRSYNRAVASQTDRKVQFELIREWGANVQKRNEIQQRELYLLDERDILVERRNPVGSINPDDEARLQVITKQLSEIRPRLWESAQIFTRLRQRWLTGSWTLEVGALTSKQRWREELVECEQKLGCCARDCGCCTRPRQGRNGRRQLLDPWAKSHCTTSCSCCRIWRGFHQLDDSKNDSDN